MKTVTGAGVVITGAGSGIGAALARRFAAEGGRVVVNDINAPAARAVADSCGGVGNALGAAALAHRHPARHRGRCGRKRGSFAEAEKYPRDQHRCQSTGHSRKNGGAGPNAAAHDERPACAKSVADPTADDLKNQIRVGKRGKYQANFSLIEIEILCEPHCGGADVDTIQVGDEVHEAQQPQDDVSHPDPFHAWNCKFNIVATALTCP